MQNFLSFVKVVEPLLGKIERIVTIVEDLLGSLDGERAAFVVDFLRVRRVDGL